MLTLGEGFSGIGGWSEAARMAGDITPIWHFENDPNKIKYYEHRHPGVPNLGDIRHIITPPYVDIFTVSFPCTGFSLAGNGGGFEDSRSALWFEAERLIGLFRPGYVVLENAPAIIHRGLEPILKAFAKLGYYAEWTHLSGQQFGIQQRRKRFYLIAYSSQNGQQSTPWTRPLFRKLETRKGLHTPGVYPGWRERRDIPEPRTYGSAHDIPGGVHRLVGTGDAIIPLIGCYILTCIKLHAEQQ